MREKNMNNIVKLGMALASVGFIGTVQAEEPLVVASIGDINGRVMVYDGQKYGAARPGMALEAGDRVITLKDASVNVNFAKGCVARLDSNAALAISGAEVCAGGMVAQGSEPLMVAQANTLGGGGLGGDGGLSTFSKVVVGVSAGTVVYAATRDNGSPASPQ
jgi:hypothetical protein